MADRVLKHSRASRDFQRYLAILGKLIRGTFFIFLESILLSTKLGFVRETLKTPFGFDLWID